MSLLRRFWRVKQTWDGVFLSPGEEAALGIARCPPGAHRRAEAPHDLVFCTQSSGMQLHSHLQSSLVPPLHDFLCFSQAARAQGFPYIMPTEHGCAAGFPVAKLGKSQAERGCIPAAWRGI